MTRHKTGLPHLPWLDLLGRLALLLTASYGVLYFSYKYLNPALFIGDTDYYYPVFRSPLNLHAGLSPFVLRQVGAVLTWLAWKGHFYYPMSIAYVDAAYDQHVFFAALLVNWLCLVLTALVCGLIAEELLGERNPLAALVASLVCILSFHTQSAVVTDLAEGAAWLLLALAFLCLLRRAGVAIAVVLVLAMFQREMILLAIGFLAALMLYPRQPHRRFAASTLLWSAACFTVYLALRRQTAAWGFQTEPASLFSGILRWQIHADLIFQGFLSQNVIFIALAAFAAARFQPAALRFWLPKATAAFAFLVLVSVGSYEGNNTGRLAGLLTPIFASFAAVALASRKPVDNTHSALAAEYPAGTNRPAMVFVLATVLLLPAVHVYQTLHPRPPKHRFKLPGDDPVTQPSLP